MVQSLSGFRSSPHDASETMPFDSDSLGQGIHTVFYSKQTPSPGVATIFARARTRYCWQTQFAAVVLRIPVVVNPFPAPMSTVSKRGQEEDVSDD